MSYETFQTEKPILIDTGTASGAITKRRFVGYDDAQITVKGTMAKGVAMEDAVDGAVYPFCSLGTVLVEAGEALAKGVKVTSNALGKAVVAGEGEHINGVTKVAQSLVSHLVEIQFGGTSVSTSPTTTTSTTTTTTTTTSTTTTTA